MTVAATLATAPLIAFHFGELSTTTLFANLLALPAVAPAMWLGMLARRGRPGARLPGRGRSTRSTRPCSPTSPRSRPGAAGRAGPICTCDLGSAVWSPPTWPRCGRVAGAAALRRRRLAGAARRLASRRRRPRATRPRGAAAVAARPRGCRLVLALGLGSGGGAGARRRPGLRFSVLDVGQGDAILLQPAGAPAVLVDGGPPGDGLAAKLRAAGVERLGAAIVTHEQSDHAGGIEELLGRLPGRPARSTRGSAAACAARPRRPAPTRRGSPRATRFAPGGCGSKFSGRRRSCSTSRSPAPTPTRRRSSCSPAGGDFSMLLTADAEAEAVPLDPGPVDVLKVAHHGSEDAGPRRPARSHRAAPRGDLGRRRQPLRPSRPRHAGRARRARGAHPAHRPTTAP